MKIKKITLIAVWSLIALFVIFICFITEMQDKASYMDRFFLGMTSLLLAGGCAITYILHE